MMQSGSTTSSDVQEYTEFVVSHAIIHLSEFALRDDPTTESTYIVIMVHIHVTSTSTTETKMQILNAKFTIITLEMVH